MGGSPSKILDDMYLGGCDVCSENDAGKWFKETGITDILSICHTTAPEYVELRSRKHIDVPDMPSTDLRPYFAQCVHFVHAARLQEGSKVYIHCAAGISRSTTAMTVYFATVWRADPYPILRFIRERRNGVCPNPGFRQQMEQFVASGDRDRLADELEAAYTDRDREIIAADRVQFDEFMSRHSHLAETDELEDEARQVVAIEQEAERENPELESLMAEDIGLEWLRKPDNDGKDTEEKDSGATASATASSASTSAETQDGDAERVDNLS